MQRIRSFIVKLRECHSKFGGIGFHHLRVFNHYYSGKLFPEFSDDVHLSATIKWLCLAQEITPNAGVSAAYYLKQKGWGVEYPETSGYIIATFLSYAQQSGDNSYEERAIRIGDWEISIQAPSGGVYSSTESLNTRVFNTGQVILGWCALYEKTKEQKYLDAANRAGEYLINEQESDGAWRKDTYCGARTYHARTDWGLLRLAFLSGEKKFAETAIKNLRWVLDQQNDNGWFSNCGFNQDDPITHVIVYTLRGLIECYSQQAFNVEELNILPKVVKAADALCHSVLQFPVRGIQGMVPTSFDSQWKSREQHSCLTGNAQLSYFLYRLTQISNNQYYAQTANSILQATKRTQLIDTNIENITGAIAGSFPFNQGYHAESFPNWAAKFFADAIMMKNNYQNNFVILA